MAVRPTDQTAPRSLDTNAPRPMRYVARSQQQFPRGRPRPSKKESLRPSARDPSSFSGRSCESTLEEFLTIFSSEGFGTVLLNTFQALFHRLHMLGRHHPNVAELLAKGVDASLKHLLAVCEQAVGDKFRDEGFGLGGKRWSHTSRISLAQSRGNFLNRPTPAIPPQVSPTLRFPTVALVRASGRGSRRFP